jgi:hypothetical protein
LLPNADLGTLRSVLDVNCRRVRYRRDTSRVTSLYFDDARLSALSDNIDGVSRRAKVRLRWYDSELPGPSAFLETKWRDGQATGKDRVELDLSAPLETTPLCSLARSLATNAWGASVEALVARPDPVVLVEYERTYYQADGAVRVTLDTDLVFYRQFGSRFIDRRFPVRVRGIVIVEGKVPLGSEPLLTPLLHPLSLRVSRSSKYVMGCHAVGAATASR